jgi:hypothetical protein
MKDRKVWDIEYQGHRIRIIYTVSVFPLNTSEVLEIDGVIVENHSGNVLNNYSTILTNYNFNGIDRSVEVRIAQKILPTMGCQVFIDGNQVGGDRYIRYPDAQKISQQLKEGFWNYFLSVGLLNYGLPFAIALMMFMLFVDRTKSISEIATRFAFHQVLYGLYMSYFSWERLKKINRSTQVKNRSKVRK